MAIHAILTDIEGTTTSLSFVKDVLFPYADQHLADFVQQQAHEPVVQALIQATCAEPDASCQAQDLEAVIAQLRQWIAADKKVTPLKALQGLMWQAGYQQGDFTGHVYPDAVAQLQAWQAAGLRLYVYSSGSVQAQQLLFAHSEAGDMTPLFSGYFDTQIGHKRETASYQAIAQAIGLAPEQILFLSDIREELDAAARAGLKTYALVREDQSTLDLQHPWASDFYAIQPSQY